MALIERFALKGTCALRRRDILTCDCKAKRTCAAVSTCGMGSVQRKEIGEDESTEEEEE